MSRWSDLGERKYLSVQINAQRMLNDSAHDRLRSRTGLSLVVAAYVLSTGILVAMWLLFGTVGGVIAIVAWFAAFVALRLAVRSQADLPDEVLDERMRIERDRAYLTAFRTVAGSVLIGATVALIGVGLDDAPASITLSANEVNAIFWALLSLMLGAPSIALMVEQRRRLSGN
jgi:hypothetical protein